MLAAPTVTVAPAGVRVMVWLVPVPPVPVEPPLLPVLPVPPLLPVSPVLPFPPVFPVLPPLVERLADLPPHPASGRLQKARLARTLLKELIAKRVVCHRRGVEVFKAARPLFPRLAKARATSLAPA